MGSPVARRYRVGRSSLLVIFDHIALALWEVADAPAFLMGALGGVIGSGGPGSGYRGGQWAFQDGARIEVIQPAGPPGGFLHRFLGERGPGIHHVTFKVPSLRAFCERAEALGYEIVGYDDSSPSWKEAFLHPRQALGILVQMAETDADAEDSWGPNWDAPQGPPHPPPPVRILGLRLVASSAERARRLWGGILDGACSETPEELVFRWENSPLRVAVTIDPEAPEGPRAIEVASDTPLQLPDDVRLSLGARFIQVTD